MDAKSKKTAGVDVKKNEGQSIGVKEHESREEEFKAKYLRALADYQNLEKRMMTMRDEAAANGVKHFVLKLLPFLDNLDRAEAFVKDPALAVTRQTLLQTLKAEDIEELDVLNKEFDPYTAEVIDMAEGPKENEVIKIIRRGFAYKGNVLRVAQVIVARKKHDDTK
jgi:molecular chaperone GrpE